MNGLSHAQNIYSGVSHQLKVEMVMLFGLNLHPSLAMLLISTKTLRIHYSTSVPMMITFIHASGLMKVSWLLFLIDPQPMPTSSKKIIH